jgi:hypothetical protein
MTEYQKQWYQANKVKQDLKSKEWAHRNKERVSMIGRKHRLMRLFGITESQFDSMLDSQNGVCAICKRPERARSCNGVSIRRLNVDHDHNTGRIRGLLCNACNTVLGKVGDSIEVLQSAISYLRDGVDS